MKANLEDALTQVVAAGGVQIAAARTASVASVIGSQLKVEQAATRGLPFELEPSAFFAVLHQGA